MKYLALLLLLAGCATAQPKTLGSCVDKMEEKLFPHETLPGANADQIIIIACRMGNNDADQAMKVLESLRYAH